MKFFRWQPGRSKETEKISKFPIWSWLGFDIYLLKFPKGQKVAFHFDKVEGKRHFRFNFTIYGYWRLMRDASTKDQAAGSYHLFRPDIELHAATFLTDCLVLSIGWIKK